MDEPPPPGMEGEEPSAPGTSAEVAPAAGEAPAAASAAYSAAYGAYAGYDPAAQGYYDQQAYWNYYYAQGYGAAAVPAAGVRPGPASMMMHQHHAWFFTYNPPRRGPLKHGCACAFTAGLRRQGRPSRQAVG